MKQWLTVTAGPENGRRFELSGGEVTIGRESSCEVVVADGQVSRRHAALAVSGPEVVVRDLNSTNGTFLNGARLASPRPLRPFDVLRVGQTEMVLEAEAEAPAPVERSLPPPPRDLRPPDDPPPSMAPPPMTPPIAALMTPDSVLAPPPTPHSDREPPVPSLTPQEALDGNYARRVLIASIVLAALVLFVIVALIVVK